MFEIGSVFPEKGREEVHVAYVNKKGVVECTLEEFMRNGDGAVAEAKGAPVAGDQATVSVPVPATNKFVPATPKSGSAKVGVPYLSYTRFFLT